MKKTIFGAVIAAVTLTAVPAMADPGNGRGHAYGHAKQERKAYNREIRREARREARRDYREYARYNYNRFEPGARGYYADRYYRDGNYYQPRRLSYNDRVYRGQDGRYYCRRSDGTTGLIVGGLAGGTLGNIVAPGGSKTLGTIIGAVAGGALGRSIDRNNVTCR